MWCPARLCAWSHSFQSLYYAPQFSHQLFHRLTPTLCRRWHTTFYILHPKKTFRYPLSDLQSTISLISSWMSSNYLTLNPSKTEFLLIGLPQKTSKLNNHSLSLSTAQPILPTPLQKKITIDFILSFSNHIASISNYCYTHIRDLRCIRHIIDFTTASTIATSLTHWRLHYWNSLYHSLPVT